jgi:hypothetical protein
VYAERNNRIGTQGTRNLIAAARAAGAGRFFAQSIGQHRWSPGACELHRDGGDCHEQQCSCGGDQHTAAPAAPSSCGRPARGQGARYVQRRIVDQDRSFELDKRAPRFKTKLAEQLAPITSARPNRNI